MPWKQYILKTRVHFCINVCRTTRGNASCSRDLLKKKIGSRWSARRRPSEWPGPQFFRLVIRNSSGLIPTWEKWRVDSDLTQKIVNSREQMSSAPPRPIYFLKLDAPSFPAIYGSRGFWSHPDAAFGRWSAAITILHWNSVLWYLPVQADVLGFSTQVLVQHLWSAM